MYKPNEEMNQYDAKLDRLFQQVMNPHPDKPWWFRGYKVNCDGADIEHIIHSKLLVGSASAEVMKHTTQLLMSTVSDYITSAMASNSTLAIFIEYYCDSTGMHKSHRILRSEFNSRYREYCESKQTAPLRDLSTQMKRLGFKVRKSSKHYYTGLRRKEGEND